MILVNFFWSQDFKKLEPVKRYKEIQGKDLEWAMAWFNSGSETETNERMGYRGDRYPKAETLKWKYVTENSEEWKIIKAHHFIVFVTKTLLVKFMFLKLINQVVTFLGTMLPKTWLIEKQKRKKYIKGNISFAIDHTTHQLYPIYKMWYHLYVYI